MPSTSRTIPIDYNSFEGTIPEGEYGGGTVMIWDRGRWIPEGDPHRGYAKGHLDFVLEGEKLHGRWHLVRMRPRDSDRKNRHDNWLLIKGKDDEARSGRSADILEQEPLSVATGRSMERSPKAKARNASGIAIARRNRNQTIRGRKPKASSGRNCWRKARQQNPR